MQQLYINGQGRNRLCPACCPSTTSTDAAGLHPYPLFLSHLTPMAPLHERSDIQIQRLSHRLRAQMVLADYLSWEGGDSCRPGANGGGIRQRRHGRASRQRGGWWKIQVTRDDSHFYLFIFFFLKLGVNKWLRRAVLKFHLSPESFSTCTRVLQLYFTEKYL